MMSMGYDYCFCSHSFCNYFDHTYRPIRTIPIIFSHFYKVYCSVPLELFLWCGLILNLLIFLETIYCCNPIHSLHRLLNPNISLLIPLENKETDKQTNSHYIHTLHRSLEAFSTSTRVEVPRGGGGMGIYTPLFDIGGWPM